MGWSVLDYPRDSNIHTYSDFFELLCLTSLDHEFSIEDLVDHIEDNTLTEISEEGSDPLLEKSRSRKIMTDNRKSDIVGQIQWREQAFSESYPFRIDKQTLILKNSLTIWQKSYLFLLFAANLPFIKSKERQKITDSFEKFVALCLESLWFKKGKVTTFGKNTTEYKGKKHERLNQLLNTLGHKGLYSSDDFHPSDSGDGGIDLAAWLDLDIYEMGNKLSTVIQCSCSRSDFNKKQADIAAEKFEGFMAKKAPWIPMLCTPISFRNNSGFWAVPSEVRSIVILDRLRLLNFLPLEIDFPDRVFPENFSNLLKYSRDITC